MFSLKRIVEEDICLYGPEGAVIRWRQQGTILTS